MDSERGKNAIALGTLLLVGALIVFGGWRLTGSEVVIGDCSFDPEAWTEARQTQNAADRYDEMEPIVEDIVKCDDIVYGKRASEIRDLLGPPDSTADNPRIWYYDVGIPPPNSDYPGLVLGYSREGSVTVAEIPGFYEK